MLEIKPRWCVPVINKNKRSDHLATRETASYILFSAKNSDISTKHTQSRTEKSLFQFSLCLLI